MAKDRVNHLFGITLLPQDRSSGIGMLLSGVVRVIRPFFVVKVVEQTRKSPKFFVSAELSSVGADTSFDSERVFAQAIACCVFAKQLPGIVPVGHSLAP